MYLTIRYLLSNYCMSKKKRGRRAYKYDAVMRSRIIELASLGYTTLEIAKAIGIHSRTLDNWKVRDPKLRPAMKSAKQDMMKGTIERGLCALANGAESKEEVKEYYIEENVLDVDGHPMLDEEGELVTRRIKVTDKTKKLAPNEKAIEILARKYDKVLAKESLPTSEDTRPLLTINTSTMTLRELQGATAATALGPVVAIDGEVVGEEADIISPPTKDSES